MIRSVGIVGVGHLATAVVTGLCRCDEPPERIVLSPRNAQLSADLAAEYDPVEVAPGNQEVVDGADVVLLALRAQDARAAVADVEMREGQAAISLMAPVADDWLPGELAPGRLAARVLILPSVERGEGPIAIHPRSEEAEEIFGPLGKVVTLAGGREESLAIWTVSSSAALYYTLLATTAEWASRAGADAGVASAYVAAAFESFAVPAARADAPPLAELVHQAATEGGLNELGMSHLEAKSWFAELEAALNLIRARLEGDG